ncbi:MAG: glutamate racemase [Bergeyella sp.]|nr:glutamate racemase [Bergeyella sp.]
MLTQYTNTADLRKNIYYPAYDDPDLPIGIFDSGVGGLTIAKEIKKILPDENFIYYGDTKNLPYGEKSKAAIVDYCIKITRFLLEKKCKAIVIACNSATASAFQNIKEEVNEKVPVVDVIHPVTKIVAAEKNIKKIGIIATKATIDSDVYKKTIREQNTAIEIAQLSTPLLVPIIEEGIRSHPISHEIIKYYLSNPILENIDTIILGCTHYPLLLKEIKEFYTYKINIIDSPSIVAQELKKVLENRGILKKSDTLSKYNFYLSDKTNNFERMAKTIFGSTIKIELKLL